MKTNQIETPKGQGKKIRVTFPNGTIIEKANACDTLAEVIKVIGVKKVASLGITGIERKGILLLDTKLADEEGYRKSQKDVGDGYYLLTKTSTDKKISDLVTISSKLNLHLIVESCQVDSNVITLNSGVVYKKNKKWMFESNGVNDDDLRAISFTDYGNSDTFIIRNQSKYGIFGLPDIGFSGYGLIKECLTDEPFPYDEVLIIGGNASDFCMIAYKIGDKWGINYLYFFRAHDRVIMNSMVPCKYHSLAEAEKQFLKWENPFAKYNKAVSKTIEPVNKISEKTKMMNLPGIDEFLKRNSGAIHRYLRMTINDFKRAYEDDCLKGRGNGFYDDLIKHINSLVKTN